jgi:serine/threonine protein kinase
LQIIADVARGLSVAHARGIVHRDVKPENILLVEKPNNGKDVNTIRPRAKLTDFGLARQVTQTESLEVTQAGTVLGTPLYMAPEQFDALPVDARTDVYALGATLFHMLTGRPPFHAESFQLRVHDDCQTADLRRNVFPASNAWLLARFRLS